MTDFRALCADLLRELEHASSWDYQQALKDQARAALADGPAVPEGREPASVDYNLSLRVQRLEAMRETEKAALLDAFKQIDNLQHRLDFQYTKLCRLEEATEDGQA